MTQTTIKNEQIRDSTTGWIQDVATWTRTGNYTFTVVGNRTTYFRKGTKIRYKDGGSYEYGTVISSSYGAPNTTVTLATNTDFAMAAATLTDTYVSYIANPEGWPNWFNYSTTFSRSGTAFVNPPTVNTAQFKIENDMVIGYLDFTMAAAAGGTGEVYASVPVTIAVSRVDLGFESAVSAAFCMAIAVVSINKLNFYNSTPAVIATTSGYRYQMNFKYLC